MQASTEIANLEKYFDMGKALYNKPILVVDNTQKESKQIAEKSTPVEKEVDSTLRKYCYKRTDGRWQYSRQQNGMLWYAIASTYRALIEKIPKIKPRLLKKFKNAREKSTTFVQFFETYINTYIVPKNISQKTKDAWKYQLEKYIKPHILRLPLEHITAELLQKIVNSIKAECTRDKVANKLKAVVRKAYLTGRIKKDFSLAIEKPKRTEVDERPPLILDEQVCFLEKAKQSKGYAFIMFSLVVGSRRSESLRLDLSKDLDEEKKVIVIHGTKTGKEDRKVNVTPYFIDFIKSHLPKGKWPHGGEYYSKIVKGIFKDLKIDNCLHGLRHTCSANLYFLGASDKYRQLQLGHKSIVTTNDIYTNIKDNIEKASLRELYGDFYPSFD